MKPQIADFVYMLPCYLAFKGPELCIICIELVYPALQT